jgi:hypothetical protein
MAALLMLALVAFAAAQLTKLAGKKKKPCLRLLLLLPASAIKYVTRCA